MSDFSPMRSFGVAVHTRVLLLLPRCLYLVHWHPQVHTCPRGGTSPDAPRPCPARAKAPRLSVGTPLSTNAVSIFVLASALATGKQTPRIDRFWLYSVHVMDLTRMRWARVPQLWARWARCPPFSFWVAPFLQRTGCIGGASRDQLSLDRPGDVHAI